MNIILNIPEMDRLSAAIEKLAAAMSGQALPVPVEVRQNAPALPTAMTSPATPEPAQPAYASQPSQQPMYGHYGHPAQPVMPTAPQAVPTQPMPQAGYSQPAQPQQPMQQPMQAPVQQPLPMQQPQQPGTLPTAAPTYTLEQLSVAAIQITDKDRPGESTHRNTILGLVNEFGVQSLTQLPKEHYGAFATRLRALGANI